MGSSRYHKPGFISHTVVFDALHRIHGAMTRLTDTTSHTAASVVWALCWLSTAAAAAPARELQVAEIPFHRAFPHAFHDQAVASVASLYPKGRLLMAKRLGHVGDFVYALVVYQKRSDDRLAILEAVATRGTHACLGLGEGRAIDRHARAARV